MKFELTGKANSGQVIGPQQVSVKVDNTDVSVHCRGVKFELNTKDWTPKLELDLLPTEEMTILEDGDVFFTLNDKKFKCIEVEEHLDRKVSS